MSLRIFFCRHMRQGCSTSRSRSGPKCMPSGYRFERKTHASDIIYIKRRSTQQTFSVFPLFFGIRRPTNLFRPHCTTYTRPTSASSHQRARTTYTASRWLEHQVIVHHASALIACYRGVASTQRLSKAATVAVAACHMLPYLSYT
jgi:hypothetical protein